MKVRMTVGVYEDRSWQVDVEVQAELTGDRQVVAVAGWEGIARRLVKKALNDFDTREVDAEATQVAERTE